MIEGRYYKDVSAIQEIVNFDAVNSAIRDGWELLTIHDLTVTTVDSQGRPQLASRPVYILGWAQKEPARQDQRDTGGNLESALEALPWTGAKSGKCDFVKDPPKELLDAIDPKDGYKGSRHHFTRAKDGTAIFRFVRRGNESKGEVTHEESSST